MSFAQPWMLFGLLGALVPIIIHLIHRFRPRDQPFPALELLLQSAKKIERRWRLRRLVLLSLRVLLLAALALAASGPLFQPQSGVQVTKTVGAERLAIVIDTSLSMQANYRHQTAFSRAIDAAQQLVEFLGSEDKALIVSSGSPPKVLLTQPTADRGELFGVLSKLRPSWHAATLSEAISAATDALAKSHQKNFSSEDQKSTNIPNYRIVVLTDLAKGSIDEPAHLKIPNLKSPILLQVQDVLGKIPRDQRYNIGLVNAVSESIPSKTPRTMEISARIQNYNNNQGHVSQSKPITLRDQTSLLWEGTVDINPSTITDKPIKHSFDSPGVRLCTIQIGRNGDSNKDQYKDRLEADNIYHIRTQVRKQIRTLIVNGDPSGIAKEDEVFYVERAYRAGSTDQPTPRIISEDDLGWSDLQQFDVVILAGVSSVSEVEIQRFFRFVMSGGGLLITTAEGLNLDSYQNVFNKLLPGKLAPLRVRQDTLTFTEPKLSHPILRLFSGEASTGLLTTRTRAYLPFTPDSTKSTDTLLTFSNHAPALMVRQLGDGRVGFLTTSIDRDLTDLPIRPSFVPLVRQIILWLGDAIAEPDLRKTYVGEARQLTLPPGLTQLQVSSPSGAIYQYGKTQFSDGTIRFIHTDEPGFYTVRGIFQEGITDLSTLSFAVNINPAESDLEPISPGEAIAILQGTLSDTPQTSGSIAQIQTGDTFNREHISRIFLIVMALAFLLESGVTALRIGR